MASRNLISLWLLATSLLIAPHALGCAPEVSGGLHQSLSHAAMDAAHHHTPVFKLVQPTDDQKEFGLCGEYAQPVARLVYSQPVQEMPVPRCGAPATRPDSIRSPPSANA